MKVRVTLNFSEHDRELIAHHFGFDGKLAPHVDIVDWVHSSIQANLEGLQISWEEAEDRKAQP